MNTSSKTSQSATEFGASTRIHKQVRTAVADQILVIMACLSVPTVCVGLANIPFTGFKVAMALGVAAALALIIIAILRHRVSPAIRGAAVIVPLFVVGIGGVASFRFASGAPFYLVSFCIMATLFFGLRGGVAAILLVIVSVEALLAAQARGVLQVPDFTRLTQSSLYYLDPIIAIIFGATGPVVGIRYLVQEMVRDTQEIAELAARRQTLNILHEETERLMQSGSWEQDLRTGSWSWSEGLCHVFDLDPAAREATERFLNDFINRIEIGTALQQSAERGLPWKRELPLTTAQGRDVWIEAEGTPDIVDGETVRLLGHVHDITASRQAEEKSTQLMALLEGAERIAGFGSWQFRRENDWSAEWSLGAYLIHDLEPFNRAALDDYIANLRPYGSLKYVSPNLGQDGRPIDLVMPRITAKGRHIWLHYRGESVFRNGEIESIHGYMQDITARKNIEDTNAKLLSRLERVERTAGVGGWEYDVETGGLHWTPGASLIHDLDPADTGAFERYLPTVWSSGDPKTASSRVVADPATPVDVTIRRLTAKGREIWVHIRAEPVFRDLKLTSVVGHYQDVTERKQNEDRLLELARNLKAEHDRAEIANAAKSQFLAMMSHELRTPLTGVIGLAELLQASGLSEQQLMLTQRLVRSASVLLDLLNDILDFSTIEAGRLKIEHALFSVGEVISDVTELFQANASEKGIVLDAALATDLEDAVIGDAKRLRQVLSNLVGNALKFTDRGSITITVRQERQEDGRLVLQTSVSDTGIGIAPPDIGRLFAPFVRAEWPAARKHGGTGLGLAISRRLVEAMGGEISVSSTSGRGSTFTFSVLLQGDRRAKGERSEVDRASAPRRRSTDRLKEVAMLQAPVEARSLLLAEDNETNRILIAAMLNRLGYTVDAVDDGHKAVMAVQAKRYDLILMDIQMPVMDGDAAIRVLRAAETDAASRIPIIALTADAVAEHAAAYRAAGADSVVTKPVDWNFLGAEIRRLLSSASVMPSATAAS